MYFELKHHLQLFHYRLYFWLHCRFVDCIKLIYSVLQQKTFPAFFNKEDDLLYKKEYSFGAKVIYRRVQLYLCRTITRQAYISILNSIPHNTTSQEEIKLPGPDSRNERIFIIECNGLAAEVHCTEETIQIPKFIPSLSECFGCIRCQKARVGTYTRPNNPLLKVIDFLTGLIERFSVPGSRRRQTDCQVCTGNQPVMWQCTVIVIADKIILTSWTGSKTGSKQIGNIDYHTHVHRIIIWFAFAVPVLGQLKHGNVIGQIIYLFYIMFYMHSLWPALYIIHCLLAIIVYYAICFAIVVMFYVIQYRYIHVLYFWKHVLWKIYDFIKTLIYFPQCNTSGSSIPK